MIVAELEDRRESKLEQAVGLRPQAKGRRSMTERCRPSSLRGNDAAYQLKERRVSLLSQARWCALLIHRLGRTH